MERDNKVREIETFDDLKPGDEVYRYLAGELPMKMIVREIMDNGWIICDAKQADGSVFPGGWTFSKLGIEEDEELGWGEAFGATGSYLSRTKRGVQ
jgi:hypothetical protein